MVEMSLTEIAATSTVLIAFGAGVSNIVSYYTTKSKLNRIISSSGVGSARNRAKWGIPLVNVKSPLYKSLFYGEKIAYKSFLKRNR